MRAQKESMRLLVRAGSQFTLATHSPILMAYPGAQLLGLSGTQLTTQGNGASVPAVSDK